MSASTEQPSSKHASNRALTEISYEKCPFFQPLPRFLLCPCCFFISFFVGNWKQKWTFFQGTTFETFRKSPKTDTLWPHLPTTRWMKCPDSITPGWRHWWIPLLQGPARACFSTSRSRDHENNNKTAAWFGSWLPGWWNFHNLSHLSELVRKIMSWCWSSVWGLMRFYENRDIFQEKASKLEGSLNRGFRLLDVPYILTTFRSLLDNSILQISRSKLPSESESAEHPKWPSARWSLPGTWCKKKQNDSATEPEFDNLTLNSENYAPN